MSKQFNVCAVYGERRNMKSAIIYAGRLASQLSAGPLHVYLPGAGKGLTPPLVAGGDAAAIQRARIEKVLNEWQQCPVIVHDDIDLETAAPDQLPPNSIIVSNELAMKRRDLTVLQPFEEVQVLRASGSILVPFGDGDSGLVGASLAIPLAKALSLEVLFYHTTWRSPDVQTNSAKDHMCASAQTHHQQLEQLAKCAGIQHRMAIEMADDVVFGMMHCALNGEVHPDIEEPRPVNLIVMAHGVNTYTGSYVEKALKISPTPILVAAYKRPDEEAIAHCAESLAAEEARLRADGDNDPLRANAAQADNDPLRTNSAQAEEARVRADGANKSRRADGANKS